MPEGTKLKCIVAIQNHCVVGDLVEDVSKTTTVRDGDHAVQSKSGRIFIVSKATFDVSFEPYSVPPPKKD